MQPSTRNRDSVVVAHSLVPADVGRSPIEGKKHHMSLRVEPKPSVYLGVWIAGAIGFFMYAIWSYSLALFISFQVGSSNAFWTAGHFGFTMMTAIPVSFGCACLWGGKCLGNPIKSFRWLAIVMALVLLTLALTMSPGFEDWFMVTDCIALALGPISAFSGLATLGQLRSRTVTSGEPSGEP